MAPIELPEVQAYLKLIQGCDGCRTLVRAEIEAFEDINASAEGIDWADAAGTDELHDYWLVADNTERQTQLGMICHVRAQAWHAIWRKYL